MQGSESAKYRILQLGVNRSIGSTALRPQRSRTSKRLLLCLSLLATFAAGMLAQPVEEEYKTVVYRGQVTDKHGEGIVGAQVDLYDGVDMEKVPSVLEHRITLTTRESGYYGFERQIRPGYRWCCVLVASADGYARGWTLSMTDREEIPTITLSTPRGVLGGIVLDSRGRPVNGATVRLFGRYDTGPGNPIAIGSTTPFMAQTGADGRFLFDGLPPSLEAEFCVEREGYRRQFTFRTDQNLIDYQYSVGQQDISITLYRNGALKGTLCFAGSGEPIANETVYISRVQGPNGRLGTYHLGGGFELAPVIGGLDNCMVTTDLAGCFEVADLLAGEYTVFVNRISARKRGWSAEQVRVQVPENETQSVEMYAVRAGYLNVEVIEKGSESKPVEGVTVRIEPWAGEAQTDPAGQTISGASDEQGRVKFQLIPGTYRLVSVGKDGQWADLREDRVLEIASGQTASVRIPFTALQGVMGTAFDPEGNPLAGAEVFMLPDRTQVSVSDEEGRFLLPEEVVAEDPDARSPEAKAQTETVMNLARQGAPATAIRDLLAVMPKPPPDARLLVARHEPRQLLGMRFYGRSTRMSGPLKIQLQPEKSVIGRVVGAEGKPIADAMVVVELVRVDLTGADEVPYVTVTQRLSDDEGRFEFAAVPLERGQVGYRVTARATGLGERAKLLREDPARAGTGGIPQIDLAPQAIDLGDFLLAPADLSVAGIVVDKYGRPLQKTTVTLESQDQGLKQTMETDQTGRFEFDGLQPGPVHLWAAVVWKGAGADVEAGTQDIRIVLTSDEVTDEIIADGFAGGAACEIRLVDAVTGQPIVDKQARLTIKQERGNTVYLDVDEDGLGRICLGQGTHEIGAQPKNYQYGKRRVTVEDSRVYQWDIEIKPKAEFEAHRTYGDAVYPLIRRDGQWIQQTPKPSVSTLRVNVKDRKTRQPVVGAVVVVTFREGSGRYEASVNEKGYANCAILEGGTYVIESVRAEGYEDLTPNRTYQLSPWSDRPIEFLLEPQPVFVTVSVVDKHGHPVPNALAKQCYRLGDKWEHAKQGRTDEDGRAQLEWIAEPAEGEPRVDHFLQVKDMRRPYGVLFAGIVRARQNDTITIPEQPQVIPKGRIVDLQGSPVVKLNVNVLCVETGWRLDFGYDQTDANGAFEIQPMPAGWDYKVVCTHGGQPHEWTFATDESDVGYLDLGNLTIEQAVP